MLTEEKVFTPEALSVTKPASSKYWKASYTE